LIARRNTKDNRKRKHNKIRTAPHRIALNQISKDAYQSQSNKQQSTSYRHMFTICPYSPRRNGLPDFSLLPTIQITIYQGAIHRHYFIPDLSNDKALTCGIVSTNCKQKQIGYSSILTTKSLFFNLAHDMESARSGSRGYGLIQHLVRNIHISRVVNPSRTAYLVSSATL
jgi:hypothetical protein